jgi:hypothetical protein
MTIRKLFHGKKLCSGKEFVIKEDATRLADFCAEAVGCNTPSVASDTFQSFYQDR